jgi:hypothetical protein
MASHIAKRASASVLPEPPHGVPQEDGGRPALGIQ